MNKQLYLKLRELVEIAQILDCSVLPENFINFTKYSAEGKVESSELFDYDDASIIKIDKTLNAIAAERRRKWEPEFMRFVPSLVVLNWRIEPDALGVILYNDEGAPTTFNYGENGLYEMADLLADALLERHAASLDQGTNDSAESDAAHSTKSCGECCGNCGDKCHCNEETTPAGTDESTPEDKKCRCKDCNDDRYSKNPNLLRLLWQQLDGDKRNNVLMNLPPEAKNELITAVS